MSDRLGAFHGERTLTWHGRTINTEDTHACKSCGDSIEYGDIFEPLSLLWVLRRYRVQPSLV